MDYNGFIIFGVITVLLLIMGVCLLHGKGAFLIAGYNTLSEEEKRNYDERSLCRFAGWLLITIAISLILLPVSEYLEIAWLAYCGIFLVFALTVGAIIYANTGSRFRKRDNPETVPSNGKSMIFVSKAGVKPVIIICVVAAIAIASLFYCGQKEPVVNVSGDSIQIKAMYGLSVSFSDIINISLIEKSMNSIGVGTRANGYGGFGGTLKGHFNAKYLGKTLLFVQADSSPTIRIECSGKSDIYVSFRSSEKTKMLYHEMMTSFSLR